MIDYVLVSVRTYGNRRYTMLEMEPFFCHAVITCITAVMMDY